MIELGITRPFAIALLLALALPLGLGCNNRTRSRLPVDSGPGGDSSTTGDSSITLPDATTGDSSVDTGTAGGDGAAAVAGFRMLIEADCAVAHRCRSTLTTFLPEATDAEFVEFFGSDEVSCVGLRYPADSQAAVRAAVDAGTAVYDAASLSPCISGAVGFTCEQFWTGSSSVPACNNLLVGTLSNGASCNINGECISTSCADGVCSDPPPAP